MGTAGVGFSRRTDEADCGRGANKGGAGINVGCGVKFSAAKTIEGVDGLHCVFGQENAGVLRRNGSTDSPGKISGDVGLRGFGRN